MRINPVGFHRPFARDRCDKHCRGSFAACILAFAAPCENDSLFVAAHLGIESLLSRGFCGIGWGVWAHLVCTNRWGWLCRLHKLSSTGPRKFPFEKRIAILGSNFFAVRQACCSWRKPFRLCFGLLGQMPRSFHLHGIDTVQVLGGQSMGNHMSRDVKSVVSCRLLDSVSSSALRHPRAGFCLQLASWTPHLSSTFVPETGTDCLKP